MTQEQIERGRIAIAERCGFKPCPYHHKHHLHQLSECARFECTDALPNYHGSLDAIHEAEKVLNLDQWHYYKQWLGGFPRTHNGVHATAPQRFEAFLKTIGKWEE